MKNVSLGHVTAKGIEFEGIYYSCHLAIYEDWFDTARVEGDWKILIVYDSSDQELIEIFHTLSQKWVVARRISSSATQGPQHARHEDFHESVDECIKLGER
ncbi:hypothetical protein OIN60_22145 [Paenibacillus sp. P96]|uniref:Uncharacterized protein n=1 Tax=Paenibacillus zeirhizosphaerae TaxID=2987519 RepID=A0ABT9FXF5_9BACL|nr:hypothetical protein [Paenibacillus sp. P96]MDP4099421.1 hypothetical protein [Paenibacillus sp. P96]